MLLGRRPQEWSSPCRLKLRSPSGAWMAPASRTIPPSRLCAISLHRWRRAHCCPACLSLLVLFPFPPPCTLTCGATHAHAHTHAHTHTQGHSVTVFSRSLSTDQCSAWLRERGIPFDSVERLALQADFIIDNAAVDASRGDLDKQLGFYEGSVKVSSPPRATSATTAGGSPSQQSQASCGACPVAKKLGGPHFQSVAACIAAFALGFMVATKLQRGAGW